MKTYDLFFTNVLETMNKRERLMATMRGETVDRPPVCFYELNGLDQNPDDPDPFNIFSGPSWKPLIELARDRTDRIVMRELIFGKILPDPVEGLASKETFIKNKSEYTIRKIKAGNRILTSRERRDPDIDTVWTEEHLIKDLDDLRAFLNLPEPELVTGVDKAPVIDAEEALGDSGIVMLDTADPLCLAAMMFDMADYTIIAMTEQDLFTQLLDRFAATLLPRVEEIAKALPGRLWRIYGPEYASAPYLPPYLFNDYVCKYIEPMIASIHRYGGFARVHSHGNLKGILDMIVSTGAMGLDPVEPPHQGDVELEYVRKNYGKDLVLFGNLEVADIENMPPVQFEEKVKRALEEGTAGEGRGFVLMPSASPSGRQLSPYTLPNYEKMVELTEKWPQMR